MPREKENKKMPREKENKKMTKVIISSDDNSFDTEFLSLTDDQFRLLKWLEEEEFLPYGITIKIVEITAFKEI